MAEQSDHAINYVILTQEILMDPNNNAIEKIVLPELSAHTTPYVVHGDREVLIVESEGHIELLILAHWRHVEPQVEVEGSKTECHAWLN